MIDGDGYMNSGSSSSIVNNMIDGDGYINSGSSSSIVNNMIDGDGYINSGSSSSIAYTTAIEENNKDANTTNNKDFTNKFFIKLPPECFFCLPCNSFLVIHD
jgi:hypothetical protein